jgi:hypothetical protein
MTDTKAFNNTLNKSREMFDTIQPTGTAVRGSLMMMPKPMGKDF